MLSAALLLVACASLEKTSAALNAKWVGRSYDEFIMAMTAARSQLLIQTYRSNDSEDEKKGWW